MKNIVARLKGSNLKKIYWLVVLVTVANYLAMVAWSLPIISNDANGLMPFDMRPTGYTLAEAHEFLVALSAEGNSFYQLTQHKLDTAFPALEALSVGWGIFLLLPNSWGVMRWLLALTALPGMIFDYLENARVALMLQTGGEDLTQEMVAQASQYTLLKSGFVTIGLVILIVLLGQWFFNRWKSVKALK